MEGLVSSSTEQPRKKLKQASQSKQIPPPRWSVRGRIEPVHSLTRELFNRFIILDHTSLYLFVHSPSTHTLLSQCSLQVSLFFSIQKDCILLIVTRPGTALQGGDQSISPKPSSSSSSTPNRTYRADILFFFPSRPVRSRLARPSAWLSPVVSCFTSVSSAHSPGFCSTN